MMFVCARVPLLFLSLYSIIIVLILVKKYIVVVIVIVGNGNSCNSSRI